MTKTSIIIFLSLLLGVSWLLQLLAIGIVGDLNSPGALPWLISLMFIPTIASLIYGFGVNRNALYHVRFRPGNPLYLILGALIPAATALIVLALIESLDWGHCEYFHRAPDGRIDLQKGPWLLGLGVQSWGFLLANIAITALAYALINSVAAVGEEFAWRGFLQGHMIEQFGTFTGIALLGLVWAIWHLPANLAGYNYPHAPVLGACLLFPALLICESFVMAWLTLRARSFWPAVLMHGSTNGIQEGILSRITLVENYSRVRVDLATIGVALALAVVCAWFLASRRSAETLPG